MRKPTHPGDILRLDILPNIRIPLTQLAKLLGISRQQLHRILTAESPVTPDTAVKLAALFKNDPQFWLNLQAKFDIWKSREKLALDIEVLERLPMTNGLEERAAAIEQLAANRARMQS